MTATNSPKRSGASTGAPGVKIFLTAASLTSIIGGWAGFTVRQSSLAQAEASSDTTVQAELEFPPMPTLVSAPGIVATSATPVATPRPVIVGSGSGGSGQPGLPPATIRKPRAPTTRTRSSR